jgi:benzodiazapine receptor
MKLIGSPSRVDPAAPAAVARARPPRWPGRSAVILVGVIAATGLTALIGAAVIAASRDVWLSSLRTPSWMPSRVVINVGWAVAYVVVAAAGWRLWVRSVGTPAVSLWALQLGLDLAWTVTFFGLWLPAWALVIGVGLVGAVAGTIVAARATSPLAAALLVPYLGWLVFAMTVNAAIVVLN